MHFPRWGQIPLHTRIGIAACAALILFSACVAYFAARTKSPVFDEPLHLTAGIAQRRLNDFRVNPEDPALFKMLATLPIDDRSVPLDTAAPGWQQMLGDHNGFQWAFSVYTLSQTPGTDGERLVQSSRRIFVLIGAMLGAMIAFWAWRLAGVYAGVIAVAFFALDPNFLGHMPLVKNDVAMSLVIGLMALLLWSFGRTATWGLLTSIAVLCAAAVNLKFSGLWCGPLILIMLLIRSLLPAPWMVIGKPLNKRWQRLLVVPAVCIVVAVTSYIAIWACYGWRFSPTPNLNDSLNTERVVWNVKAAIVMAKLNRDTEIPIPMVQAQDPGAITTLTRFAEYNRLLPQAWLYGFLYTYATTLSRLTYLLGTVASRGTWYYFPCAILFKTPLATLIGMPIALAAGIALLVRRKKLAAIEWIPTPESPTAPQGVFKLVDLWTIACLIVPPALYLAGAMSARMNIGLRHVLPIYPFIFVGLGTLLAMFINAWRKTGLILIGVILLGLAVESLSVFPNYIAFFNTAAGGARGGIKLLGDSNLDWGQDLKLLAEWQRGNPQKLYFCYFGNPDPAFYGIRAIHTPGGWFARNSQSLPQPNEDCFLAISATCLQGIYQDAATREIYRPLWSAKPFSVLGATIYIYKLPLVY